MLNVTDLEIERKVAYCNVKKLLGNDATQDEKDCHEMIKIKDDLHHLSIALNKAKRQRNYSYYDVLKGEIKSREKRLEKLRSF